MKVTINIPDEDIETLKKITKALKRNRKNLLEFIILGWIANYRRKHKLDQPKTEQE